MKKLLFACIISLMFTSVWAQENKKPVDSKIDNVTVFLTGAQITRSATVTIPKGTSNLVFRDVSTEVIPQSIQIAADNEVTILAVNHQINYLENKSTREEESKLEAQLKALKEKVNYETAMLQVFQQEESMLIKNQAIGGNNVLLKAIDLKEAMDFQRARMTEVKSKQLDINKRLVDYNKEIAKIEQQLAELNSTNYKPSGEIVVNISATEASTSKLQLTYVVRNAGWYPTYGLRVTDISKPINLNYKANVYQTSGEDWTNVKLTLSSGNPNESGTKPELEKWNLSYSGSGNLDEIVTVGYGTKREMNAPLRVEKEIMIRGAAQKSKAVAPMVMVATGQTTFQFIIEQPYNIPSDGKQHTVNVQERTINALYEYYCAPKLDKDVFLTARITGWEEMNLLSGEANLYYEGTYLGKAMLNTHNTSDTLDVSLGRDKNIAVTRIKQKEFSKKQVFGSNKTDERRWEISIRNKKLLPVNIVIEDQYPTSTDKDIVVERGEAKEATLDEATNKLTWRLKIDAAKEKKIGFSYSVKYPKSSVVILE
jgi:uncharacterized protein (TIGR02231 family)